MKYRFLSFLLCNIFIFAIFSQPDMRESYLSLIKQCLTGSIYKLPSIQPGRPGYDQKRRENGQDWPAFAHTMVGLKRLNNIQYCYEQIRKENVPGDLIETGVWRGGATIFMRSLLFAYNDTSRTVWVADSFEGLPKQNVQDYPADARLNLYKHKELAVSLDQVKENFSSYQLLDDQVQFLKGWFKDTLPQAPIEKISLLRLDGDLYESTIQALTYLYPKLSVGGYVIIDDFIVIKACKKAVFDYRKAHNIEDKIEKIDSSAVFWKKSK